MKGTILLLAVFLVLGCIGNGSEPIDTTTTLSDDRPVYNITRSMPKGDFAMDDRDPMTACRSLAPKMMENYPGMDCELSDARSNKGFTDMDKECLDGYSVAGCYICTFACKKLKVLDGTISITELIEVPETSQPVKVFGIVHALYPMSIPSFEITDGVTTARVWFKEMGEDYPDIDVDGIKDGDRVVIEGSIMDGDHVVPNIKATSITPYG